MKFGLNEKFWNIFPYAFGILVISTTIFFGLVSYNLTEEKNKQHFLTLIKDTEKHITKRYSRYEQALQGALGFLHASDFVSRKEWELYVESLNIKENLPGINGIGYIAHVEKNNLSLFLEKTKTDYAPNFKNHPKTEFNDKFIIKYITPLEGNIEALGLDIGFENNRRFACEYSRDKAKPALTKKIELVQDKKRGAGFLMLIPHYKDRSTPDSVYERRKNILGWVYAPFIADNFFKDFDNILSNNQISYAVYDDETIDPNNIIHSNLNENSEPKGLQTKITLSNSTWLIDWHKNKDIKNPTNHRSTIIIVIIGILLSIVSTLLLKQIERQRNIITRLVNKKTIGLKKSEEFSWLIMNTIPDLIFVKDENFKIVKANKAFLDIYPPEQRDKIIGYTTIENFSKEEADISLKHDKITFENGISQVLEKITLYNGKELNIFTTKVRFTDENNQAFILGIARDISELVHVQKNLEKKVEERTGEYKKQKLIAEKAAKIKEEFLANMSHELRTPLNSIIGLTNILSDEANFTPEHEEFLNTIQKSSQSLLKTVNDILDITKLEAGKIELESEPFDLNNALNNVIDQIKPIASQKGLEVHHNLNNLEQIYIKGDEHRLSRILTNLTGNAVKYTEKGNIGINVSVETKNDKTHFICEVSDTGIGISEKALAIIFDKFKQAEKSTERKYGGTGLGLSITKQLVDLMKGKIFVKSQQNKGSTFTVKIPIEETNEAEYLASQQKTQNFGILTKEDRKPFSKAHVLIAEDHHFNQILITKLINRLGCNNITISENGYLALEQYQMHQYDLVLMDCHMPEMSGYEAKTLIRDYERSKKIETVPIFAMTADVMAGTRDKCIKAGMDEYISKPIEESYLKALLEQYFYFDFKQNQKKSPDKNSKNSLVNLSLIQQYADHDPTIQKDLIQTFYDKSLEDIQNLEKQCIDGYSKEWTEIAHTMKGASSYIGAKKLTSLCNTAQMMEDASKEERQAICKKIKSEYEKIIDHLKNEGLLD